MPKLIVLVVNTMELVHSYEETQKGLLGSNNANNNGKIARKPQLLYICKNFTNIAN